MESARKKIKKFINSLSNEEIEYVCTLLAENSTYGIQDSTIECFVDDITDNHLIEIIKEGFQKGKNEKDKIYWVYSEILTFMLEKITGEIKHLEDEIKEDLILYFKLGKNYK